MDATKKCLIITGSAPCVIDDLTALAMDDSRADFMAIGLDAIDKYCWPVKYVATYHPEDIPQILARREARIGRVDFAIVCHKRCKHVDIVITDYWQPSGSSALLGVQAALRLGYRRIILAGCPLTGKNDKGGKYENFRNGWEARRKEIGDHVRSMSGWTAEFLGWPTKEWLLSEENH